jgi:DnaJ-class molecular chaperone
MKQEPEPIKPIVEKPFRNSVLVICGFCRGRKVIKFDNEPKECPYCHGEGTLERITEGIMRLCPVKSNI